MNLGWEVHKDCAVISVHASKKMGRSHGGVFQFCVQGRVTRGSMLARFPVCQDIPGLLQGMQYTVSFKACPSAGLGFTA